MEKRNKIIIGATLILIFLGTATASLYLFSTPKSELNMYNSNLDPGISNNSNLNDSKYTQNTPNVPVKSVNVLGSTDYGKVTVEGPYGNSNSKVKIAVITGVHPLESDSHKAAVESIKSNDKSLNYCYYIYRVTVTRDADNYDKGRMNGQLLANKFVVPHVINQNYNLALDIHSNRGVADYSKTQKFIFAPAEDTKSKSISLKILDKVPGFVYYTPASQTSPRYVTIPLVNAGTPAVVYETYIHDSYQTTRTNAQNLINSVDNIKF